MLTFLKAYPFLEDIVQSRNMHRPARVALKTSLRICTVYLCFRSTVARLYFSAFDLLALRKVNIADAYQLS